MIGGEKPELQVDIRPHLTASGILEDVAQEDLTPEQISARMKMTHIFDQHNIDWRTQHSVFGMEDEEMVAHCMFLAENGDYEKLRAEGFDFPPRHLLGSADFILSLEGRKRLSEGNAEDAQSLTASEKQGELTTVSSNLPTANMNVIENSKMRILVDTARATSARADHDELRTVLLRATIDKVKETFDEISPTELSMLNNSVNWR